MRDDPAASLFLEGMLPGGPDSVEDSSDFNQLTVANPGLMNSTGKHVRVHKAVRVKTVKRKVVQQDVGYKWPYYDSYAPGLGMNKEDKRIVRKGVIQQYFPNQKGNFNNKELKYRTRGIKDIE